MRWYGSLCLCILLVSAAPVWAFTSGYIDIKTKSQTHNLFVQFATTVDQRQLGLMYRKSLDPYQGMIFDFKEPQHIQMWMKNTFLSLDMLFIDEEGRIVEIVEHTVPYSQDIITSNWPVRYVLELQGGMSKALRIKSGDRVLFLE